MDVHYILWTLYGKENVLKIVLRKKQHGRHTLINLAFTVTAVEVFLMPGYADLS